MEYVSKKILRNALFNGEQNLYSWEEIEAKIDAIPAADVVPVRRMEWKQGFGFPKYCSECGFMKHIAEKREYNFCPNCGAKME